ncbi:MAG: twin-arginine translocase subunit TatC [Pseudomonadota bacterium]
MSATDPASSQQTLIDHLVELRSRLIKCLLAVVLVFACLYPFANEIYTLVAQPLLEKLPEHSTMIATEVTSPFMAPFKLTMVLALFLAMPVILYQVWAFVAPGLYKHEKQLVLPLLVTSMFLFAAGVLFVYYVMFPVIFDFFMSVAPQGVTVMTDVTQYLDFVLTLFIAAGLMFQVPIATVLLVRTGMTTVESLREKRPYFIVGAFVIGMLLTPPDVFSQSMLAIPMCLLFEVGLLGARLEVFAGKPRQSDDADQNS